ncbi:MAG: outer membrane beta-barrel protein [Bauldia sp.]
MQKLTIVAGLAGVSLLALTATGSAADFRRAAAPVPPPAAIAAYNWNGVYFGINGGWGWGESDWEGVAFDTDGGLIGGTVGVNWRMGTWVVGLEGDLDWANIEGSVDSPEVLKSHTDWLGTARVRAGMPMGNFLFFGTAGLAAGGVTGTVEGPGGGDAKETHVGWTAGLGVEVALTGAITAKGEWLYYDLGGKTHTWPGGTIDLAETGNLFRLGLNWRM